MITTVMNAGTVEVNTQNCATVLARISSATWVANGAFIFEGLLPDNSTWVKLPVHLPGGEQRGCYDDPLLVLPSASWLRDGNLDGGIIPCAGFLKVRANVYNVNTDTVYVWLSATASDQTSTQMTIGRNRRIGGSATVAEGTDNITIVSQECATVLVEAVCADWGTALVEFQGLLPDHTTWIAVPAWPVDLPYGQPVFTAVANGRWFIPCAGYPEVRAHVTSVDTSAVTVTMEATSAPHPYMSSVGKFAEDFPASNGDYGQSVLAVRQDTLASSTTLTGDYANLKVTAKGALYVTLGTSDSGGPVFAEDTAHTTGDLGIEMLGVRRDVAVSSSGSDGDYSTLNLDDYGHLYARSRAYDAASNADRTLQVSDLPERRTAGDAPVPIISVAQDFLIDDWHDLGVELPTMGCTRITLWLSLDVNDSTGMQVRMQARHTSGGSNYCMPTYLPNTGGAQFYIETDKEYFQFHEDIDQLIQVTWDITNTVPYVQFQIRADALGGGGTEGQVLSAYVTYGWAS